MLLNHELAKQISSKAHAILKRDLMVADTSGLILSGQGQHGTFAADALRAGQEGRRVNSEIDGAAIEWFPFVYEKETLGVFGVMLEQGTLTQEAIGLMQGLAEVIVHQHFLLDKIQSTTVVQSTFIKELLQGSGMSPDEAFRQADILQLNLRAAQAVLLARLSGFERSLHAKIGHLSAEEQRHELAKTCEQIGEQIKESFQNFQDNVISYLGDDTFVVLKSIGGSQVNTVNSIRFLKEKGDYLYDVLCKLPQKADVTIGVGQYYPDLGGLRKSYQDAKLALEVGAKVWGPGQVYHIKDVGMFTTLANVSHDRKAELAHQILHPLLRDQQLFKTVEAFLTAGLSLTDAAKKLHIHRNTLIYRLDKTKKLINLDPRHFDDALQIKLGLMFY